MFKKLLVNYFFYKLLSKNQMATMKYKYFRLTNYKIQNSYFLLFINNFWEYGDNHLKEKTVQIE